MQSTRSQSDEQFQKLETTELQVLAAVADNRNVFSENLNCQTKQLTQLFVQENDKNRQETIAHLMDVFDGLDLPRASPSPVERERQPPSSSINAQASAMLDAAKSGDLVRLEARSQGRRINFDVYNEAGQTPLHLASEHGHLEVVKFLFSKRANLNYPDDEGRTPLHVATTRGNVTIVRFLLSKGADKAAKKSIGMCPETYAVTAYMNWLFTRGLDREARNPQSQNTVLFEAIVHNDITMLGDALQDGAILEAKNQFGNTALIEACMLGRLQMMQALLAFGAEINVVGETGYTPLMLSVWLDRQHVVRALSNHDGIDLEIATKDLQKSALLIAVDMQNWPMVMLLVEKGAEPNAVECWSGYRHTVLNLAIILQGPIEVVCHLLDNRANIHLRSGHNVTAIMEAVHHHRWDVVRLLAERGADVREKSTFDRYPVICKATIEGQAELIPLLMEKGADIEAKNIDGWTAMNEAVCHRRVDTLKVLLDHGADVSSVINTRHIPGGLGGIESAEFTYLMQAVAKPDMAVLTALLAHGAELEAKDSNGWTALRHSVEEPARDPKWAVALLYLGADIHSRDRAGLSVIARAEERRLDSFVTRCRSLGRAEFV